MYKYIILNHMKSFVECPDNLGRCVDHGQQVSDGCFCKVNGWQWSVIGKCYGK